LVIVAFQFLDCCPTSLNLFFHDKKHLFNPHCPLQQRLSHFMSIFLEKQISSQYSLRSKLIDSTLYGFTLDLV
jgi:hypothetical protein